MQDLNKAIICITGRDCSGKDTLTRALVKKYPELFHFIVTHTTRPIRPNETNGTEHIFYTDDEFDKLITENNTISELTFNGCRYCTLESDFVSDKLNLYIVDPSGILYIKEHFPDFRIMTIYLWVNKYTAILRSMKRQDNHFTAITRSMDDDSMFFDIESPKSQAKYNIILTLDTDVYHMDDGGLEYIVNTINQYIPIK